MSLGWEPDDIVEVINSVEEKYGEIGLKTIEKALAKSAYNWGKQIRKKDFPDINPKNFLRHFQDNPYEEMDFIIESDCKATIITRKCLTAEIFEELDSMKIGFRFKCIQDYKIAEGYDQEMKLEILKCLMKGDNCCVHRYSK